MKRLWKPLLIGALLSIAIYGMVSAQEQYDEGLKIILIGTTVDDTGLGEAAAGGTDALLMELGDYVLMESGDKILLEN